jgi:hypothetical protein
MKKILALAFIGFGLMIVVSACGSSRGGHCDAYGSANHVESSDLAKK